MNRSLLLLGAGLLSAALLVGTAVAPWNSLTQRAGDYDLIGMLSDLNVANGELTEVNAAILTSLTSVREQADGVERIHARLQRLEQLVADQGSELDSLRLTTAQQVELSRAVAELTAALAPSARGMARTAGAEAALLEAMSVRTARMAGTLQDIGAHNRSITEKLGQAEELSGVILARMP